VTPKEELDLICDKAHELGLKVHLDGARVFNASTCLRVPVNELCSKVDTVMFCLSKGLGAPAGSMLVGSVEVIDRARLYRKRLGGGMRQAGVLAAPGLIALEEMSTRLADDHANARFLADGLSRMPGVAIEPAKVQTNILIFDVSGTGMSSFELSAALKSRGILANGVSPTHMRMVTHFDVDRAACKRALSVVEEVVSQAAAAVG
jgi:threonine aldolase